MHRLPVLPIAAAATVALLLSAPVVAEARPPVAPPGDHSFVLWHDVRLPSGVVPSQLTVARSGTVWFVDETTSTIGAYDPATEVFRPIPATAGAFVHTLVEAPDGGIWFSDPAHRSLGRIDPTSHTVTSHAVPPGLNPAALTVAPDGTVWFGTASPGFLGRIAPGGAVDVVPLSGSAEALDVAWGADGRVWATRYGVDSVLAYDPATDTETSYRIPTTTAAEIEAASDGSLWLPSGSSLIRLDTGGGVQVVPAPPSRSTPAIDAFSLRTGPGPAVLVYADTDGRIVTVDADGSTSVVGPAGPGRAVQSVGVGPDGAIWFSDSLGRSLGWG